MGLGVGGQNAGLRWTDPDSNPVAQGVLVLEAARAGLEADR
jgi:hypothetical protein